MSKVLFATSMDPLHLGHVETIMRFERCHGSVVVGLGVNPTKTPLFSVDDRITIARLSLPEHIEVVSYEGPTMEFAREIGANVLGRSLRTGSDLDYEAELMFQNHAIASDWDCEIDTVHVLAREHVHVSSSRVRELVSLRVGKKALRGYLSEAAADWVVNVYYKR